MGFFVESIYLSKPRTTAKRTISTQQSAGVMSLQRHQRRNAGSRTACSGFFFFWTLHPTSLQSILLQVGRRLLLYESRAPMDGTWCGLRHCCWGALRLCTERARKSCHGGRPHLHFVNLRCAAIYSPVIFCVVRSYYFFNVFVLFCAFIFPMNSSKSSITDHARSAFKELATINLR